MCSRLALRCPTFSRWASQVNNPDKLSNKSVNMLEAAYIMYGMSLPMALDAAIIISCIIVKLPMLVDIFVALRCPPSYPSAA